MKDVEKVEILREHGFTGIDLPMISKLKQPEIYGIQLTDEARRCLGIAVKPNSGTQRRKIIEYCEKMGSITSLEATNILHIMSFTKRMSEIRRDPTLKVTQSRESDGHKRWLLYKVEEERNEEKTAVAEVQAD